MSLLTSEIHNCSWKISTLLESSLISSSCQGYFPLTIRPMRALQEIFQKIFCNFPKLNCSIFFSMHIFWMTKKTHYFLRFFIIGERECPWFNIDPSPLFNKDYAWWRASKFYSLFSFGLRSACESFASSFNAYDSSWTPGIYVSLFKFTTNLFDPWEFLTQEWVLSSHKDQILISTHIYSAKNLVATSNTAQSLCFPGSILLVVTIQNPLEKCIPDKPMHKIVKYLECLSWNTVRFQQHSGILHPYKICSICLVVTASQFVLRLLAREDLCEQCHHNGTRLPHHNGSLRSLVKGFILFTHLRDCSVKTELIYRSNCSKTVVIVSKSPAKCIDSLPCPLLLSWPLENGLVARKIRHPLSANSANIFSAILSHSPCGLSSLIQYHFFSEPRQINDYFSFSKSPCVQRYEFGICQAFFFVVFWSTRDVIEHRHIYDSSCEILCRLI